MQTYELYNLKQINLQVIQTSNYVDWGIYVHRNICQLI